jgi:hypothetical protein
MVKLTIETTVCVVVLQIGVYVRKPVSFAIGGIFAFFDLQSISPVRPSDVRVALKVQLVLVG